MALKSWWRRFLNNMREVAAGFVRGSSFVSVAYFDDGGYAVWQGRPKGRDYDAYREMCRYVLGSGVRKMTDHDKKCILHQKHLRWQHRDLQRLTTGLI
jgi:hypothetical protein